MWVELCPQNDTIGVLTPSTRNVTLSGNRVFADVIKLRRSHNGMVGGGLIEKVMFEQRYNWDYFESNTMQSALIVTLFF